MIATASEINVKELGKKHPYWCLIPGPPISTGEVSGIFLPFERVQHIPGAKRYTYNQACNGVASRPDRTSFHREPINFHQLMMAIKLTPATTSMDELYDYQSFAAHGHLD